MAEISKQELLDLQDNSYQLLKDLVTPEGIYASSNIGWEGPYHAWFGRDGAISADFLLAACEYGGDRELAQVATQALKHFATWQGKSDDPATGERTGKIPHEIRTEFDKIDAVQHAQGTNMHEWYVDATDQTLKNWDTADGTSLWILAMLRSREALGQVIDQETEESIRSGLGWILRNLEDYDGLIGFTGADEQPGRVYSGLHNQGWKDSQAVYQTSDGDDAPHPIKDVLVNAEAWAALSDGASYFMSKDLDFSQELQSAANGLKQAFNSTDKGFLLKDRAGLAQAIDGDSSQLTQSAIDQGAVLWAHDESGGLCIDSDTARMIADRMLSPDMFNPEAGIRDYAKGTVFTHGTNYHGSPNTYWPFMSGMVARGLEQLGYVDEAERVMTAYLKAVRTLGTNIEMFIQDENDRFEPWSHPDPEIGQKSSREQAWTAAAVYYATHYLLSQTPTDIQEN